VQDEDKKYMLTGEGKRALELLKIGNGGVIYPQVPKGLNSLLDLLAVKPVSGFSKELLKLVCYCFFSCS
jgi:hypothetical protein